MVKSFLHYSPHIDQSAYIDESAQVIGRVYIDSDVSVWPGAVLRGDVSEIHIGKRSNIQDLSVIHVDHTEKEGVVPGSSTIIGDDVTVGHRVILHACEIGSGSLIGMGSVILDAAVIGEECIVGAGSLVTKGKTFPPRSLLIGSPAKAIRQLTEDEVSSLYDSAANYVKLKDMYL